MKEKLRIIVDEKGDTTIFMDGQELNGVKSIEFYHEAGDIPTHKVEFFTPAGGMKNV